MSTFGISFRGIVGGLALAAGFAAAAPSTSFGAAAAAKGLTSATVVSTDPALRQITLAFDPCCGGAQPGQSYNVDAFQLSVNYNPKELTLVSTTFAAPFKSLSLDDPCNTPTAGVSDIAGIANPNQTTPGDVDLFYETFQLKSGYSLNTALTFTFGADNNNDYLYAVNSNDPNNPCDAIKYTGPNQIQSTTITTSISSVPLPKPYLAGGLTLLVLGLAGAGLHARSKRTL